MKDSVYLRTPGSNLFESLQRMDFVFALLLWNLSQLASSRNAVYALISVDERRHVSSAQVGVPTFMEPIQKLSGRLASMSKMLFPLDLKIPIEVFVHWWHISWPFMVSWESTPFIQTFKITDLYISAYRFHNKGTTTIDPGGWGWGHYGSITQRE